MIQRLAAINLIAHLVQIKQCDFIQRIYPFVC